MFAERLGLDHVDLIQLHDLVEPDEWEVAHGPGGAVARSVRWVLARPQLFLVSSSDAHLLEPSLAAAEARLPAREDADMQRDVEHLGLAPLFDGADLERI